MKKNVLCVVEFEIDIPDGYNPLAEDECKEYTELYLANALEESNFPGMFEANVNCIKVEDVKC